MSTRMYPTNTSSPTYSSACKHIHDLKRHPQVTESFFGLRCFKGSPACICQLTLCSAETSRCRSRYHIQGRDETYAHTWKMRALPPKNQLPRRMTARMLMALDRVPPRYSQLLRLASIAARQAYVF